MAQRRISAILDLINPPEARAKQRSAGRVLRMVISLDEAHELDANTPSTPLNPLCTERDEGQLYPPALFKGDWIDIETKRRTFWFAYTIDRFTRR